MRLIFPCLLLLLTACPPSGDSSKDSNGGGGDTGTGGTTNFEPGCITVDGGGGYAYLQDAITVASDGSTITLCDGTYEEIVTVDKAVTITGTTAEGTVLTAPTAEVPLTITATGVAITNLTVQSTYNGIDVQGEAYIEAVTFDNVSNWPIYISGTASLESCTIDGGGAGGVRVAGGTANLSAVTFVAPSYYGVYADDGADVTIEGSVLSNIAYVGGDNDGSAIYINSGTLTMADNTITNADLAAVFAESSTITMSNDALSTGAFGVVALQASLDLSGVTIDSMATEGIYAYHSADAFTLSDTTVTIAPETSCSESYNDSNASGFCGGMVLISPEITLSNITISGYENHGLVTSPYTSGEVTALSVDGLTISDTARMGAVIYSAEGTLSNVSVSATREPELTEPCGDGTYIYLDISAGILFSGGEVTVSDSSFIGNGGWGLATSSTDVTVTNTTFDANTCSSVSVFGSDMDISGSSFSNNTSLGGLFVYQGSLNLTGNTFSNNHAGYVSEYTSGTDVYQNIYSAGYALDVFLRETEDVTIDGNTFSDGDNSIQFYMATGSVTNNTWTDYDSGIFYAVYGGSYDAVTFTNNTIDQFGGPAIGAEGHMVEADGVEISGHRSREVTYDTYINGTFSSTSSYTSESTMFYAYNYSSSGYPGSLSLSDSNIESTVSYLFYLYDAPLEVDDVTVEETQDYGVYGYFYSEPANLDIEGLTINAVTSDYSYYGTGLYIINYSTEVGYVSMSDITLGSTNLHGIYLQGLPEWSISGLTIGSANGYGIYSSDSLYSSGANTVATLQDATITNTTSAGVYIAGGSATLSNVSVTGSADDGLGLSDVIADIQGNVFTGNGQYGMICATTVLTNCADNDLSGNTLGTHYGCDDACGLPAGDGGEDSGTGGEDSGL